MMQMSFEPVQRSADIAVRLRGVRKTFKTLDTSVVAADGIDVDILPRSVTAFTGPSGSGKSTLLHLIGALDRPDAGTIEVFGRDITRLTRKSLPAYRRELGFVFQRFNLLPTLTVLDNVLAPIFPHGVRDADRASARELLTAVGLAGRENTLATRLSGGQQQRVALARALITRPKLLLADEPTGNLDSHTGEEVVDLLFALRDERDATLIVATHDAGLAGRCDDVVRLKDGRVEPSE